VRLLAPPLLIGGLFVALKDLDKDLDPCWRRLT
jgi:hypothetical protein